MSSKKLLFIISIVLFAGSLMSFNANSERNINTSSEQLEDSNSTMSLSHTLMELGIYELGFLKDTLPSDVQERVTELRRKREQIRKEVQRIKGVEEAKAARIAKAEETAQEKESEKANKEAIAQIKAEEKAKKDAIKQQEKAARKAEAERIALEKKKQREIEAVEKAKIKAQQDAIAEKEKTAKKAEADKLKAIRRAEANELKAIRKAEAEKIAEEKRKQRELESLEKDKLEVKQDAVAQEDRAKQKVEADKLKAIRKAEKKAENERLALEKQQQRDTEAVLKAQQKANAKELKTKEDVERDALRAKVAKAQANVKIAVTEKDKLKAAKKRDADIAKAAKQKEREVAKAIRAKEREEKAVLRAQQKAEAAAIAAELVYDDEDPPGYEATPDVAIPQENPTEETRLKAESVEVANKKDEGEQTPKVKTEPILPPPPPTDATDVSTSKTKDAVAEAFNRKRKKRNKKGSGIKLPGMGSKSEDIPNDVILEECDFEFNEFDPITQKVKRGLSHRYFFSYTSDILKEYMQGEDYLVCTGGLIDIQGIIALSIKYEIDSPQARYEYGSIGTNAQMILQLIDGETITLLTEQSDSGRVNRNSGKTEFSTIFLVNPREEKTLRKTEISAVRMVWGTGYEDYEVNELDFLINQFQCIDAARGN